MFASVYFTHSAGAGPDMTPDLCLDGCFAMEFNSTTMTIGLTQTFGRESVVCLCAPFQEGMANAGDHISNNQKKNTLGFSFGIAIFLFQVTDCSISALAAPRARARRPC